MSLLLVYSCISACVLGRQTEPSPIQSLEFFNCQGELNPSPTDARRLTKGQLLRTLFDVFNQTSFAFPILTESLEEWNAIPGDGIPRENFERQDNRISQLHINTLFNLAAKIADRVSSNPSRVIELLGACGSSPVLTRSCAQNFINSYALRFFRRPPTIDEQRLLISIFYNSSLNNEATAEIIRKYLVYFVMSPNFYYRFETQGSALPNQRDVLKLTDYEIASRISFHFYDSMPSAELFADAQAGRLSTEDGFRRAVKRAMENADPIRTRSIISSFYGEWLRTSTFSGFANTAAFHAFRENIDTSNLPTAMVDEINQMWNHYTWKENQASMRDIMTSKLSFTRDAELAKIYQVRPLRSDEEPQPLLQDRQGMMERALFLASGNHLTNPVQRGVGMLRRLACNEMHTPGNLPPGSLNPPPFDPQLTTRERYHLKTSPALCASCHKTIINPFGFAFEKFDALGRIRETEIIRDDVSGNIVNRLAIDTQVHVNIGMGIEIEADGPAEIIESLLDNGFINACFSRNYFRFTYGRREQNAKDGCSMDAAYKTLQKDGIQAGLQSLLMHPDFRHRKVGP